MPILRDWEIKYYDDIYPHLIGKVYNDPRFPDGTEIITSLLFEMADGVAQTKNTMYILEEEKEGEFMDKELDNLFDDGMEYKELTSMYFITTLTDCSDNNYSSRCVGYVKDKEVAIDLVENNIYDIFETIYHYAVIERIPEGIYQYALDDDAIWFKFNIETEKYEQISKPKELEHICGFSIG
jgi:hypothetical protein